MPGAGLWAGLFYGVKDGDDVAGTARANGGIIEGKSERKANSARKRGDEYGR